MVDVLAVTSHPLAMEVAVVKHDVEEQETMAFVTVMTEHGDELVEEFISGSPGLIPSGGGSRGLITGAGGKFGSFGRILHMPRGHTVCECVLAMNEDKDWIKQLTMQPKSPQPPPHPNIEQPPLHEKIPQTQKMLRGPVVTVSLGPAQ